MGETATAYSEERARVWARDASVLLGDALRGRAAEGWGVSLAPAGSWNVGDDRLVPRSAEGPLRLTHDEREAPVVLRDNGDEDCDLLVSLSDEDELAACAWLRRSAGTPVVGLGVDLASTADFAGSRGRRFNRLLFTEREHGLVAETWDADDPWGYAFAFSAKEAAFKSCAAPLRRWYEGHDEQLLFDVRGFELLDADHEVGTARHGEAQRAMDMMGVRTIELHRMRCGDRALTLALALA